MFSLLPDAKTAYTYGLYESPERLTALLNEWCGTCHSLFYMRLSLVFNRSTPEIYRNFLWPGERNERQTNCIGKFHQANEYFCQLIVLAYRDNNPWLGGYLLPILGNFVHYSIFMLESTTYTKLWWSLLLRSIPKVNLSMDADEIMPKPEQSKRLQSLLLGLSKEIEKGSDAAGPDPQIMRLIEEFNTFLHRYTDSVNGETLIILLWRFFAFRKSTAPPRCFIPC